MRDYEPVEGIDYIVDHYSILAVEQTASTEEIKDKYRELAKQHHPDVVSRAAPELQATAERRFRLIDTAYKTLGDSEKRKSYDELLQSFPPYLVSRSGNALVNIQARRLDLDFLLQGSTWEGRIMLEQQTEHMSGFDTDLLELAEQQYNRDPTDKTKKVYKKALLQELAYLSVREEIAWAAAGVSNPENVEMVYLPEIYAEQRAEQIAAIPEEIEQLLTTRIDRMLKGTAAPLLLPGISEGKAINQSELQKRAVTSFQQHEEELQQLAKQRSANLERLISLTDFEYVPAQQKHQKEVLIAAARDDVIQTTMLFAYDNNTLNGKGNVDTFDGITVEAFRSPENEDAIAQYTAMGSSVMLLHSNKELNELLMELCYVAMRHFDPEKS